MFFLVVFYWSLGDRKSALLFRKLLSIVADLTNTVICIVKIHSLISSSSGVFSKILGTIPSAPVTVVTFIYLWPFSSLPRIMGFLFVLWQDHDIYFFFRLFFIFNHKPVFFFLLINMRYGLCIGIKWFVCSLKSQIFFCVSFPENWKKNMKVTMIPIIIDALCTVSKELI